MGVKNYVTKLLTAFAVLSAAAGQYIHSNDTFSMILAPGMSNQISAPPGAVRDLEFVLTNNYENGHFMFRQYSEDNFEGTIVPDAIYVPKGASQTIVVEDMRVPDRPDGEKVKFTLTAVRDSGYSFMRQKREDIQSEEQAPGGSGSNTGGGTDDGDFVIGDGTIIENIQETVDNVKDTLTDAAIELSNRYNDPTFRDELSVSVDFTVSTEFRDDDLRPSGRMEYFANNDVTGYDDDGSTHCMFSYEDLDNCKRDDWTVKFTVWDERSGLHLLDVLPTGGGGPDPVWYRYENFPMGTNKEQEVSVKASCCLQGVMLRATDIAGNQAEMVADNNGGDRVDGLSDPAKYAIIAVSCIVGVALIGAGIYFCVYKKKYGAVPTS